jgi:hypothetical protein
MKLAEFTNKSHMVAHYSEFNLDSSIIDAIMLTNLCAYLHLFCYANARLRGTLCCCFLKILAISLKSDGCKRYHFVFNVGISNIEARNIRLVNIIASMIEESKLNSE